MPMAMMFGLGTQGMEPVTPVSMQIRRKGASNWDPARDHLIPEVLNPFWRRNFL